MSQPQVVCVSCMCEQSNLFIFAALSGKCALETAQQPVKSMLDLAMFQHDENVTVNRCVSGRCMLLSHSFYIVSYSLCPIGSL